MKLKSRFRVLLGRRSAAGPPGVEEHRRFVGGLWEELGRLQFEFLVSCGLRPEHVLLDVACGSLRGGVHFIRYLEPGNYLGLDREPELIARGLEQELGARDRLEKRPELVVSSSFEFSRFSRRPDFALAQSLFTHLTEDDIRLCLENLRAFVQPGHVFFATFNEGDSSRNAPESDPHGYFAYPAERLAQLGRDTGWAADYVGEWGHPRCQRMMRFTPA